MNQRNTTSKQTSRPHANGMRFFKHGHAEDPAPVNQRELQFIDVDGVRLRYIDRGSGAPVVLLHGNGTMILDFELAGVVALAEKKYRVIAFDRPGFGYTERPHDREWTAPAQAALVHAALAKLGVHQPVMAGHSWGAFVALAYLLDYPEDTRNAVLASGYYFPTVRLDAALLSPSRIPGVSAVMRHTISPMIGRMLWDRVVKRLFDPAPVTEEFRRYPKAMSLRPSQLRAASEDAQLMVPTAESLSRHYDEIYLPIVLAAGDGDKLINTEKQTVHMHRAVPLSELHIVQGAGHMLHHTDPRAFMKAIDAAFECTEPSPAGITSARQSGFATRRSE